jgi:hypothetical protein
MRLARVLNWRSVEEMLTNLSYAELLDWEAFYSIEPFPDVLQGYENARLLALIANANRDPEKRSTPFEITEFLLDFWVDTPQQAEPATSSEQIIHAAYMINAMCGGKVVQRSEMIQ